MKHISAKFQEAGQIYLADTCEPLRHAVKCGALSMEALARGSYPGRRLPTRTLTELCTAGYWDAPQSQSWGLDWHRNEGIEFTFLSRGRLGFAVDGREFPLQRGNLTIARPWQLHRVGDPNVAACRLYWLILDVGVRRPNQPWQWPSWLVCSENDLRSLTRLLRLNEKPVWRADGEIGRCFEKLGEVVSKPFSESSVTHIKLFINQLLVAVLEMLKRKRIPLDESLTSTQRSVELFLKDLPRQAGLEWDLESMAEFCGLGRSRFAYYCRQITNMSPLLYLARCRVETASGLLRTRPELNITEIALSSGFQSSQYFATVFRREKGVSPRQFRTSA